MPALQHRVRYHEVDGQGFLFNARYLELADVAMTEFFRALGWAYDDLVAQGTDPSVVSAQLTFRRPARFDDLLELDVRCTRVGTSSFDLEVEIGRHGESVAFVALVYVNVDVKQAAARPLPTVVANQLRAAQAAENGARATRP